MENLLGDLMVAVVLEIEASRAVEVTDKGKKEYKKQIRFSPD
jgi:hypothetical protein